MDQDICPQNVLAGLPRNVEVHKSIVAHRVYIIDFDISRRFKLGPGVQPAITLPDTQISPPNGLRHFDPYSWDVYCMALTMESVIQVGYVCLFNRTASSHHSLTMTRQSTGTRRCSHTGPPGNSSSGSSETSARAPAYAAAGRQHAQRCASWSFSGGRSTRQSATTGSFALCRD